MNFPEVALSGYYTGWLDQQFPWLITRSYHTGKPCMQLFRTGRYGFPTVACYFSESAVVYNSYNIMDEYII